MINKLGIASVFVSGIFAQWISWRFRLPSIVLLLSTGFLMGPVTGFLEPDALFGDILFPFVSLSVAIILFEGGLSLKFSGMKANGAVIRNLITIGALISWGVTAWGLFVLLKLPMALSILLGAILIVTGPTVIIPLLKQIHLKPSLAYVLRWEGIVIDPIAATLAVLIYEFILSGGGRDPLGLVLMVLGGTLLTGLTLGVAFAFFLILILKRHWIPGFLQESVTLMMVVSAYVLSDLIQLESGLLTVTVMGIVLANQRMVVIKHIISFKENLTVLLLSALFIVLAARITLEALVSYLHFKMFLFMALLIFVARPLSVLVSCMGSSFKFKERMFIAFMAPRGIVAAAVVSLFALRLIEEGHGAASELVPITFLVIMVTVVVYGFAGVFLARVWQLSPSPNGFLVAGAHGWAREIAAIFKRFHIPITLVDTNKENVLAAKNAGLTVIHGSILSKAVIDEVQMSSMRVFLALTASDKTNLLSVQEYADILGDLNVYRLYPKDKTRELLVDKADGQYLFPKGVHYSYIAARALSGAMVKPVFFDKEYSYQMFKTAYPKAVELFLITQQRRVLILNEDTYTTPNEGDTLIAFFIQH